MSRPALTAPACLLAVIAVAGCGSSGSGSDAGSRQVLAGAGIALAKCMRSHGVPNFPDPGSNGGSGIQISASQTSGSGGALSVNGVPVSAPAFKSAMAKCQRYTPSGSPPSAAQLARLRAGALKMAECMRAHGVANFPDPRISAGPAGFGVTVKIGAAGTGIDPTAPAFQAAQRDCRPLLGGPAFKASRAAQAAVSSTGG